MAQLPAHAFRLFPRLQNRAAFVAFNPRLHSLPPLGHNGTIDDAQTKYCVRHLYHDLGVIAFAGCTHEQAQTMGSIIEDSLAMGDPGGITANLTMKGLILRRRYQPPTPRWTKFDFDQMDNYDSNKAFDGRNINDIAVSALKEHLRIRLSIPETQTIQVQQLDADWTLRAATRINHVTAHEKVPGRGKTLPIEAFATLRASPIKPGTLLGAVRLQTGGTTGRYIGHCRTEIVMHVEDQESTSSELITRRHFSYEDLQAENREFFNRREETRDLVRARLLSPLMELERAVYGDKLLELAATEDAEGEETADKL